MLVFAAAAWHVVSSFLVTYPDEIWQVDLEVYREGAYSLVNGRQVYEWLTDAPQYLPFTYPPFAALVGTPLLLVPFRAAGWIWTVVQLALLWYVSGVAFRAAARPVRAPRRGWPRVCVAAVLVQLQPMQDSIRYGQVNAVIVALCLADLAPPAAGGGRAARSSGLATAVKLTPRGLLGALDRHPQPARPRWRRSATAAVVTRAHGAVRAVGELPPTGRTRFSTRRRLGPNADTANQSMRGVLLRLGPSQGPLLTLSWAVCVVAVGWFAYRLAARFDRLGNQVAVVAALGMLAFLVSPVSWIHHMYWGVVAVGALVGDGRDRRRIGAALVALAVMWSKLPWTGQAMRGRRGWQSWLGLVEQQAYCWLALGVLLALWWLWRGQGGAGPPGAGRRGGGPGWCRDRPRRGSPCRPTGLADGAVPRRQRLRPLAPVASAGRARPS